MLHKLITPSSQNTATKVIPFNLDINQQMELLNINNKLAKINQANLAITLPEIKENAEKMISIAELIKAFESCNILLDEDNKKNNSNKNWYQRVLNNKLLTDNEKAACEKYKLLLLTSFLNYLIAKDKNKALKKNETKENKPETKMEKLKRYAKLILFTIFGVAMMVVYSLDDFPGIQNLLVSIVPGIGNPVLLIGALIVTGINLVLLCSFELSLLQKLFGVSIIKSNLKDAFIAEKEQLKAAKTINHLIENKSINLPTSEQKNAARFIYAMNQDIHNKKTNPEAIQEYHEHPFMQGMRIGVTLFGVLMTGAGGYFLGPMILAALAPFLLGTVPGWIIIGAIIVTMIVGYLAMQGQGMWNMFNPAAKSHVALQTKLEKFECNEHDQKEIENTLALTVVQPEPEKSEPISSPVNPSCERSSSPKNSYFSFFPSPKLSGTEKNEEDENKESGYCFNNCGADI